MTVVREFSFFFDPFFPKVIRVQVCFVISVAGYALCHLLYFSPFWNSVIGWASFIEVRVVTGCMSMAMIYVQVLFLFDLSYFLKVFSFFWLFVCIYSLLFCYVSSFCHLSLRG